MLNLTNEKLRYFSTTNEIPNMHIIESYGVYTACVHYSLMPLLEETESETDSKFERACKDCINIIAKKLKNTGANALVGVQVNPVNYSRTMMVTIAATAVQLEGDEVASEEYNEKRMALLNQKKQEESIIADIQNFKKSHNTKDSALYALQQMGRPCTVEEIITTLKINIDPLEMMQILKGLCNEDLVIQEGSSFKFNI